MSDCCTSFAAPNEHPNKHRCPVNGIEYSEVSARTVAHHIVNAWQWDSRGLRYFFCEDPGCDVVYFGEDDSVIVKSQLRHEVGCKTLSDHAMLCYCFGITKADAQGDVGIRDFVVAQTRLRLCACVTRNPSGRCCLKSFPRNSV